jgi:AcrR family transcriptional regulator
MEEGQRTRILEAMAEVVAERGAGAQDSAVADVIARVIARAGTDSATFNVLFSDREACLLAAFELGVERAGAAMGSAYRSESRWLDAVKAALASFLWFLEEEPALGRLLVVHSAGSGARVLHRRREVLAALAGVVDRGRAETPAGAHQPPAVVAEGVVGAVLTVVQNRLLADDPERPAELFGPLISIVALPYLGAGVARRELTRPAPRLRSPEELESSLSASLTGQEAGTRLTYRTARVLTAIDDYPGASNREVAERAGIVDQGQVSKLLARLEARGLIEKAAEARTRGAPNSWRLSGRGEGLVKAAGLRAAVRASRAPGDWRPLEDPPAGD